MVMNEVYTGAGLTATMIPEIDFELSELVGTTLGSTSIKGISTENGQKTLTWTVSNTKRLVPDIYKGCVAKLAGYNSSGTALNKTYNLVIKSNTENTLVFNEALSTDASHVWTCTMLGFGSPVLAPSNTSITGSGVTSITIVDDGAGIPYAANQSLTISGSGGSGATASYTLTKHKNTLTCVAETSTNYDGKSVTIKAASTSTLVYRFWFNAASGGTDPNDISGTTDVEVVLDTLDAAGTVASKLATVINAQIGLTATATNDVVTVESSNGGFTTSTVVLTGSSHPLTKAEIVIGGEIDAVIIGAAGSGYSSATVANITSGTTNATFTAVVGSTTAPNLLADNWLGLVNTITPPTVEAEMKQMNMALGGTRNFNYQYKGAETPGSASIDVSASHGMWLYYALGNISHSTSGSINNSNTLGSTLITDAAYAKDSGSIIYREKSGSILPVLPAGETNTNYKQVNGALTYTITESNAGDLPSFALEVTAEKGNISYATQDSVDDKRNHYSKIYTGMQVNSLSLNFEEGQDVKMTVDAMCRKVHDAADNYIPKAGLTDNNNLFNRKALPGGTLTQDDTKPYMFSDGSVKSFGQTLARIKSGTLTINNSLTAQRFVGNYDRTIVSAMTTGQRTYEVQLTMLITDNTMWAELRKQTETGSAIGDIELEFEKDDNTDDKITIKLRDYITTAVDIPFPDDKTALEVSVTLQARTLQECTYRGKWIIQG